MKLMGIVMRVLAVCIQFVFVIGGILAGKVVTWYSSSALVKVADIMKMDVNWYVAAIVWILGLAIALATYGQGMILSALAKKD